MFYRLSSINKNYLRLLTLCGAITFFTPPNLAYSHDSASSPSPALNGGNSENSAEDISHGEVIHLFWKKEEIYDKNAQTVTLTGGARVIRGNVTLDSDTLIGYLRNKAPSPAPKTSTTPIDSSEDNAQDGGSMELYRVEARGHVHIIHNQDQGWGDHGLYDVDKDIILLTGTKMKFVTPQEIITARDLIEYYPKTHISIARGNATVTTKDGKRITGDILEAVGKSTSQKTTKNKEDNKLDRAYGWGHLIIRSNNQTATGDRGIYLFDAELARLVGHVHVTQGQNQNNGSQALVNMKTGISRMLPDNQSPIQGLVMPNEAGE